MNEFLLRKAGKSWDDVVEEGATIADINEDSVRKFIADSRDKGRIPDTDGLNILQVLDKLRLADGSKLKRAAIILFGKDPNRFYPNVLVKIGRFGNDFSDLKFQEVVEGNLVHMLEEVQVQLNYKFLTQACRFCRIATYRKRRIPRGSIARNAFKRLGSPNLHGRSRADSGFR